MISNIDTYRPSTDCIFETEFLPHASALKTFAYHLVYNKQDTDDLVQETFLKAYRYKNQFRAGTNSKAWLFKILKNEFINDWRKKSRKPTQVELDEFVSYTGDLRVDLHFDLMGDEVTEAIISVKPNHRDVLRLCDIEGYSYEDAAEALGITIDQVRSRLFRARNLIKNALKDYAPGVGIADYRS